MPANASLPASGAQAVCEAKGISSADTFPVGSPDASKGIATIYTLPPQSPVGRSGHEFTGMRGLGAYVKRAAPIAYNPATGPLNRKQRRAVKKWGINQTTAENSADLATPAPDAADG